MKEHPILFSAPMVRAILDGRKTQTRRIVKLPKWMAERGGDLNAPTTWRDPGFGDHEYLHVSLDDDDIVERVRPKWIVGDRLWVKETFAPMPKSCFAPGPDGHEVIYRVDHRGPSPTGAWKPSIFMPRWASRITLEVTGVRVQRLPQISQDDCVREGVHPLPLQDGRQGAWWKAGVAGGAALYGRSPLDVFRKLWVSINGPSSWAANPWVWVVEFKVVTP